MKNVSMVCRQSACFMLVALLTSVGFADVVGLYYDSSIVCDMAMILFTVRI